MSRKPLCLALAAALAAGAAPAADTPRFRGPEGDGKFAESGLLKAWPEGGPKMLWAAEGLGESYASVTVVDGRLYTTGMTAPAKGQEGAPVGSAYALDLAGKTLWQTEYGPEFDGRGYPGTRTTPTFAGGGLYLMSALGKAVSLDAKTGAVRWAVDLFSRFDGKNTYFGAAESPLLVDGKVVFTPGGPDASVVALDPGSGETVWTTKGLGDGPGYCTPRLFDDGKRRQIVTFTAKHLVGIDPASGEVMWRAPFEAKYDIHAVSPAFSGDTIYVSHGYDQGGRAFQLAADGRSVTQKWTEEKLDVHHGGVVVEGGRIYGAASNGTWVALDAASGQIAAEIPRLGKGAVVYADGRLYGYTEKGEVLLVDPDPGKFKVISSFTVEQGSGNHWSHPVVANGVLYVRHGEVLMAFDVKGGV